MIKKDIREQERNAELVKAYCETHVERKRRARLDTLDLEGNFTEYCLDKGVERPSDYRAILKRVLGEWGIEKHEGLWENITLK